MRPRKTILCVDNDEHSLSIRKVMLETRGYRVIQATRGRDALEIFARGGIDLLLTDLVMPELDGHDLIVQIKAMSPETPAVLLSGRVRNYDRESVADVFLSKGNCDAAALLERIRILLIRKPGPKRAAMATAAPRPVSAAS